MNVGRNDQCPCGSGKKFKKCCIHSFSEAKPAAPLTSENSRSLNSGRIGISAYTIAKFAEDKSLMKMVNSVARGGRVLWTPSKIRALSTEEIVQKIESVGIKFDETCFLNECQKHKYAWRVSEMWLRQIKEKISMDMDDFLGLASCILWERFNSPKYSYEMLDDLMQEGYAFSNKEPQKACDIWWKAWDIFKKQIIQNSTTADEVDAEFSGTQCFSNWCQDFRTALLNSSIKNREYAKLGVTYCSEFLEIFGVEDDKLFIDSFIGDIAEMYALSGDQDKGERLMRELIENEPQSAKGYAVLAQIISYRPKNGGRACIEEQIKILEQAQSYPVVDGKDYSLEDRLEDLKKENSGRS